MRLSCIASQRLNDFIISIFHFCNYMVATLDELNLFKLIPYFIAYNINYFKILPYLLFNNIIFWITWLNKTLEIRQSPFCMLFGLYFIQKWQYRVGLEYVVPLIIMNWYKAKNLLINLVELITEYTNSRWVKLLNHW